MSAPLLVITASGLARETAAACRLGSTGTLGWSGGDLLGFLDDDPAKAGTSVDGLPVLGTLDSVVGHPDAQLVICAGKGAARRRIAARLAALGVGTERFATIVGAGVQVPGSCEVGAGSILLPGTVLTTDVTLGRHVVCMPNVTLTHDDVLADFATLAAGVCLGGGVHVGEAAYLGMNASVREGCTVGAESTLGMGSALISNQPASSTWAGVPARELTKHKELQ
jgi:sugar O-acyltransferase (sialic acid O-acetyltransferase NeuD family)